MSIGGWSNRRPLVGIMCCNEFADRPVQCVATRFIKPLVHLSQASPLLVPAVTEMADLDAVADAINGLLLTGSRSNVRPQLYGAPSSDAPCDPQRDEVALSLSSRLIERGKPVFGICRGLQEINVLFGGTLRDLDGDRHHASALPDASYESLLQHRHGVLLRSGGVFGRPPCARPISVTSAHRQAIDHLGSGLFTEAVSTEDGVVEAISAPGAGASVLAVQWHPEVVVDRCDISRSFYGLLGSALRGEATWA